MNKRKIRVCADGKPTDTANKALVGFLAPNLSQRSAVSLDLRDFIDEKAGAVGSSSGSGQFFGHVKALDKIVSQARLVEVDIDIRRGDIPQEVSPKESFVGSHEVNRN